MIIFLDESLTRPARHHLESMFRVDTFLSSGPDVERGLEDIAVYEAASELGATVYICSDIKQLRGADRTHERDACRAAGLHWIGLPKSFAKGKLKAQTEVARLLEGYAFARRELLTAGAPTAILLREPSKSTDGCIQSIEPL